jgi:hypothetical protein
MNLIKLQKAFATSDGKRAECAVLLGDPETKDKRTFKSHLVQYVIPEFGTFTADKLAQFAEALAAQREPA